MKTTQHGSSYVTLSFLAASLVHSRGERRAATCAVLSVGDAAVLRELHRILLRVACASHLVADAHPEVAQVVLTCENLQVPAIRNETLDDVVNLFIFYSTVWI